MHVHNHIHKPIVRSSGTMPVGDGANLHRRLVPYTRARYNLFLMEQ